MESEKTQIKKLWIWYGFFRGAAYAQFIVKICFYKDIFI